MSRLRMVVATNPARLLARAAHGLFPVPAATTEQPWPTLAEWLVLRQGGLRDDFHALAANAKVPGWFDSPVCLFAELAMRWGTNDMAPLSDADRLALLTELLAQHANGVFDAHGHRDRWVPAVDRMVRELIGEGISPQDFRDSLSRTANHDAFETARDTALASVYDSWCATLATRQRVDGRDSLMRLAHFIEREPETFARNLGGRRDIRIVGLADLRGGWAPLLRALKASKAVDSLTLYTSYALPLPTELQVEVEIDAPERDAGTTLADALFCLHEQAAPIAPALAPTVKLIELPDVAREIETIAVRVRQLVDAGSTPSCIAVLFRNARPGVDAMISALSALGVPTTARSRTALAATGPARAVRSLLDAVASKWTRAALLEIAEHPLLSLGLDANVVDVAGRLQIVESLNDWSAAFANVHDRCVARDAREAQGQRAAHREAIALPPTVRVAATLAAWKNWRPIAEQLEQPQTATGWFAWTHEVLTHASWGVPQALLEPPDNDFATWRADLRAVETLVQLTVEWRHALAEFGANGPPLSAEAFADRLGVLMSADLITQPETGFGVVVSEALAAGWRAFEHVFIVGLSAGEFPLRVPPSSVFPDDDRRALQANGLPIDAPDAWRKREDELFRVLCAAPSQSLTLSWPAMDIAGREVVRSAYVDEVVDVLANANVALETIPSQHVLVPAFPTLPRVNTAIVGAHALRVAAVEATRSRDAGPHNGAIEDPALRELLSTTFGEAYVWSATQLEGLAKCQWSWFAQRVLKMDERAEASEVIEPSASGTILHDALDRFYEMARVERNTDAVYLTTADASWVRPLAVRALDAAWHAQAAELWLGLPAFHGLVRTELHDVMNGYLDFEMAFNEKSDNNSTNASKQIRMGAAYGELAFDHVTLRGHNVSFQMRGIVDRVDRGVDTRIDNAGQYVAAIDYKTTVYSTPGGGKKAAWDDGVVLQVPLYAAVLRTMFPNDTLARMEYRTLRKPEAAHQLQFFSLANKKGQPSELVENANAERQMQTALDAAGARVEAARTGVLPAKPVPSCGCSPYCPARDACRIPGGPVEADGR